MDSYKWFYRLSSLPNHFFFGDSIHRQGGLSGASITPPSEHIPPQPRQRTRSQMAGAPLATGTASKTGEQLSH